MTISARTYTFLNILVNWIAGIIVYRFSAVRSGSWARPRAVRRVLVRWRTDRTREGTTSGADAAMKLTQAREEALGQEMVGRAGAAGFLHALLGRKFLFQMCPVLFSHGSGWTIVGVHASGNSASRLGQWANFTVAGTGILKPGAGRPRTQKDFLSAVLLYPRCKSLQSKQMLLWGGEGKGMGSQQKYILKHKFPALKHIFSPYIYAKFITPHIR